MHFLRLKNLSQIYPFHTTIARLRFSFKKNLLARNNENLKLPVSMIKKRLVNSEATPRSLSTKEFKQFMTASWESCVIWLDDLINDTISIWFILTDAWGEKPSIKISKLISNHEKIKLSYHSLWFFFLLDIFQSLFWHIMHLLLYRYRNSFFLINHFVNSHTFVGLMLIYNAK